MTSEPVQNTDPSSTDESEAAAALSPAEQAEARRYARRDLACELLSRAADLAFLGVAAFLLGGPGGWLMRQIPASGLPETLRLGALFLLLIVMNMAVTLPFAFYSGFVLEHQFGLSRLSLRGWAWRYVKRHLLEIAFGLVLVPGLYWLIWLSGASWWIVASVAFFLVSVVIGQLAPVVILPLFYKIERVDDAELTERLARLAEGTGLTIEGVYRMDLSRETVKANAMLTGLGRTRRVLLGDTLLTNFTPEEIEVIFAHEIGHHVFHHIPKMVLTGAAFCAAGFWLTDTILVWFIAGTSGQLDYAHFPIHTLPLLMLILTLFSLVLEPLQNAISRRYERQCDSYALSRTGSREAYRTAFRKLARLNKDDPSPHPLEVFLLHSHPPIAERLAAADR